MNPSEQREELERFLAGLPTSARNALAEQGVDVVILTNDIAAKAGLVLYEMGGVCEGVRRVLSGEDAPNNLVAVISQDRKIEDDNRGKIPAIAEEIQKRIFDPVLPILKQAGMPVKEGRITYQYTNDANLRINTNKTEAAAPPVSSPIKREGGGMDERHLRSLLRIAAGTSYSEDALREAFEGLPEGLKSAVASVDTANAVQEIAKKFLLHIDQIGALSSETGLVLLGLTHPRDFVKNLAARLRISEARALEVAREVSTRILGKVREALRGLHEARGVVSAPRGAVGQDRGQTPLPAPKKEEVRAAAAKKLDVLAAQVSLSSAPEELSRDEVLQGIEQPTAAPIRLATSHVRPETSVGPTGWRPPAVQPTADSQRPTAPTAPKPPAPAVPPPPSEPSEQTTEKGNFVDEKLAGPAGAPREIRRYTTDPYREPIE